VNTLAFVRWVSSRKQSDNGFTLIELLVVIAIVSVLTAILLAAIASGKKRVQQAQCANNVRQLGLTLQLFVVDYRVYPLVVNPAYRKGGYAEHQTAWWTALQGVLTPGDPVMHPGLLHLYEKGIWLCPSGSKPSYFPEHEGYMSYGYNAYGLSVAASSLGIGGHKVSSLGPEATAPPVKDVEVVNPGQLVVIGDGFKGGKGVIVDGSFVLRRSNRVQDYLGSTTRARTRHKQRANVAFCDGHIEGPSLDYLFDENADEALSIWNRDNQPHRELLTP